MPPSPGPLPPPPLPLDKPQGGEPAKAKLPAPDFPLSHVLKGAGGGILALVYWDSAYRGYVEVYPGDQTPDGWRFVEKGGKFFLEKVVGGKLRRYSVAYREGARRVEGRLLPFQELVLREEGSKGAAVRIPADPRLGGTTLEERDRERDENER